MRFFEAIPKKRLLSIVLTLVMTVSFLQGAGIKSLADSEENEEVTTEILFADELNFSQYPTGDLTTKQQLKDDTDALSTKAFKEEIAGEDSNVIDRVIKAVTGTPSYVDNSTSKYFPAVGDQHMVGACVCWADVYYAYTFARCKAYDIPATGRNVMSPAFIYNHVKTQRGGTYETAVLSSLKYVGTPSIYTADFEDFDIEEENKTWFPQEDIWEEAAQNRISSYTYIYTLGTITSPDDSDLNTIKNYLSEGHLVTYTTDVYGWNYSTIPSGSAHSGEHIVVSAQYGESSHRMTIVGYDDNVYCDINGDGTIQNAERGAFKVVNSWGTGYMDNGFCWVSYDAVNLYSQAGATTTTERRRAMYSFAVQNVEVQNPYITGINAVFSLNTCDRQQVNVYIEATDKTNANNVRSAEFYPANLFNYLHYALDGSTGATTGTLLYDLANVVPGITADTLDQYTWKIIVRDNYNDGKPVVLEDACIMVNGQSYAAVEADHAAIEYTTRNYEFKKGSLQVTSFTSSVPSPASVVDTTVLTAEAVNGSGNYEYHFGTIVNGQEYDLTNGYTDNNSVSANLFHAASDPSDVGSGKLVGNNTLYVDVRDKSTREVKRKTINNYEVKGLEVTQLNSFTASGVYEVGEKIYLHADVENEFTYRYNTRRFSYVLNGVETNFMVEAGSTGYDQTFIPTTAGTYIFKYYIKDCINQETTKSITVTVLPKAGNTVTVYYNNGSWNHANIHYAVDNGSWTAVPGVAMEASDRAGYTWKYTIDLGTENGASVCFNNGNNWWDSRNGSNYRVTTGTVGISNGTVTEIETRLTAELSVDRQVGATYNTTKISVQTQNGTPVRYAYYIYPYGTTKSVGYGNANSTSSFINFTPHTPGIYTIEVDVTDAGGNVASDKIYQYAVEGPKFKSFTAGVASPQATGTQIILSSEFVNVQPDYYNSYSFKVSDGISTQTLAATVSGNVATATWTPTAEGTYTLTAVFTTYLGVSYETTMQYVIANGNSVTIYYNNGSWNHANIHYAVNNGSWTAVPGVSMKTSDRAGYTWMYTIDLANQNGANVCFNNGSNWWDSRNGSNYYVGQGTYAIENGTVVQLS